MCIRDSPPVVPETPLYSNGNGNGNGAHTIATNVVATPTVQSQPTVTAPVSNGAVDTSKMEAALMEVVSEKTGYPAEMLELNMDMEADLGIDSIKRVEIFGALTAQNPSMSDINPNELTELRTLGEIVDYVSSKVGGGTTTTAAPAAITTVNTPAPSVVTSTPAAPTSNGAVDTSKMEAALMEVVSEKTGYPAEMLELNMDMEADLGIDSIKRVEIFGALTAQNPSMSDINPNELTELRTLGEIVDYVSTKVGGGTSTATTAAPTVAATPTPVATPSSNSVSNAELEKALLEVVSEKTGYPAEMLEMNMDCLLYTSPSPRDATLSRMPSSA